MLLISKHNHFDINFSCFYIASEFFPVTIVYTEPFWQQENGRGCIKEARFFSS